MATITATVLPDQAGVRLAIDFSTEGATKVSVGRMDPTGFVSLIRAGDQVLLTAGKASVDDYEAPLDVPVYYTATKTQPAPPPAATANSATVTIPSSGRTWLKDPARPSRNMVVPIVTSVQTLTRPSRAGVFPILERSTPIVVTNMRQSPVGAAVFHTLTSAQRTSMVDILSPGSILLLQTDPRFGWNTAYIHVGDVVEARVGLATEPARQWTLPFTVVDRPEGLAEGYTIAKTWGGVKQAYATWGDLKASGKTWEKLLEDGP